DLPGSTYLSVDSALEYFPEMGRLVYAESGFKILYVYNPSTNSWSDEISWATGTGSSGNFTEYDPVNGVLYFGGGVGDCCRRDFYKLSSNGAVARLADAPVNLGNSGAMTQHT